MKKICYLLEEEKNNQCNGRIQVQGHFDQTELTAFMGVMISWARSQNMDVESMIGQILNDEEKENLTDQIVMQYIGQLIETDDWMQSTSLN